MVFNFTLLLVGFIQLFGFFVEGCAGFGGSVIGSPINAAILGPDVSIPFATLLALPVLYYSVITTWRDVSVKDLSRILIAMLPGFLLGNYIGAVINETYAKVGIGGAVTLIALINIYRHIIKPLVLKIPEKEEVADTKGGTIFRYTCLVIGSVVHGAFTIGGPLITVYTLNAVKDKYKFRATMLAMWAILDTFNAGRHAFTGMWSTYVFNVVLVALPFTFIGYYFGFKLLKKINREQFLRFVYVVLLAVGGNMFIRSLITVLS
jgi:uncharacterized membrane protein YfcA